MASSHHLTWLADLKASQLKKLAVNVGVSSSGTKALLVRSLQAHLPKDLFGQDETPSQARSVSRRLEKPVHIISIDMGIRNLAYCRITLPIGWPSPQQSHTRNPVDAIPSVTDWARIAISSPVSFDKSSLNKTRCSKAASDYIVASEQASTATTKESFDPCTLSALAYELVMSLMSRFPSELPSHILIERQRYRSMGGAAVQEWTLRVNTFEAMLYAVMHTLKEKGEWHGLTVGVAPGRVASFWLGDEDRSGTSSKDEVKSVTCALEDPTKKKMGKSAIGKLAKIKVVETWLQHLLEGNPSELSTEVAAVSLSGKAKETAGAFLRKRRGEKGVLVSNEGFRASTEDEKVAIGKLDDLADCLLQGLAWIEWERTRRKVIENGEEALIGLL